MRNVELPAPHSSRGFTLVELVVVMFLLALVAGLALPSAGRGIETIRLRAEVSAFAAFLRYGREQAITTREAREVRIDADSRSLALFATGAETPLRTRRLSPRLTILADPPNATSVTFSPQGLASGGNFTVESPERRSYRIAVDPMTGRVTTHRLDT
jgi:type IV fimbrial biogenesis protein FimU